MPREENRARHVGDQAKREDDESTIEQGAIFWLDLGEPAASEPAYRHMYVVVQNNVLNRSRINTVILCGITPNLKYSKIPGNVRLQQGEANVQRECVVNVTQLVTVNKGDLEEWVGKLPRRRVTEIIAGIDLVLEPRELSLE